MSDRDLSQLSMLELFRLDAESQVQALTDGLLALERNPGAADQLEVCMRAAHSLKGAARIVGLDVGVKLTHAMEDCFVAAQRSAITLGHTRIEVLLRGVDLLNRIATTAEADIAEWEGDRQHEITGFLTALSAILEDGEASGLIPDSPIPAASPAAPTDQPRPAATAVEKENIERVLRVTADNLNRLLGLAGESLVESRWLKPFTESLLQLKRLYYNAGRTLETLNEVMTDQAAGSRSETVLADARHRVHECYQLLSQRLVEIGRASCRERVLTGV